MGKKIGRPKAFEVMLPPTKISEEMMVAIEGLAMRPDIGSKAAAVRRLLEAGLWGEEEYQSVERSRATGLEEIERLDAEEELRRDWRKRGGHG